MLQSKSTIPSLLLLTMAFLMGGGTAADPIDTECKGKGGPTLRKQVLNQLIESMNGAMPLQGKEVQQATNYLNLAFCYKKEKDETEATNNFQRAVNLHPALLSQYAQFFGPVADPNANILAQPPPVLHQLNPELKVGRHLLDAAGEFLDPYMDMPDEITIDAIGGAMKQLGMDSCNLIFGIDYTASNIWQGKWTFEGKNLHHPIKEQRSNEKELIERYGLKNPPGWMLKNAERNHPDEEVNMNPYERVIELMGLTLDKPEFDADGLIPAFGFGDDRTGGTQCFNLKSDKIANKWNMADIYGPNNKEAQLCNRFNEVLTMYHTKTPKMNLSGPTNIGPIIRQTIEIVKKEGTYHMLVIVADGQVDPASSVEDSIAAIVEASHHPLSIVLIGVGDGPWHTMIDFDDKIEDSKFDNFQFVNFHEIVEQADHPQEAFAYYTLEEVNTQYTYIKDNILPSYKNGRVQGIQKQQQKQHIQPQHQPSQQPWPQPQQKPPQQQQNPYPQPQHQQSQQPWSQHQQQSQQPWSQQQQPQQQQRPQPQQQQPQQPWPQPNKIATPVGGQGNYYPQPHMGTNQWTNAGHVPNAGGYPQNAGYAPNASGYKQNVGGYNAGYGNAGQQNNAAYGPNVAYAPNTGYGNVGQQNNAAYAPNVAYAPNTGYGNVGQQSYPAPGNTRSGSNKKWWQW